MKYKLLLSVFIVFQIGCTSAPKIKSTPLKESAVRTLLDGTFIVRKTKNTPLRNNLQNEKFYQYYSGLHANSIGCKSYSESNLKVANNEKAYKCVVNGKYLTQNSIALGTPWQ